MPIADKLKWNYTKTFLYIYLWKAYVTSNYF